MAKAQPQYVSISEAARLIECSPRSVQRALADTSLAHIAIRVEGERIVAVQVAGLKRLRAAIAPGPGNPNFRRKSGGK